MIEPPSQKEEKREKILGGIKEDPSKIFKVELIFGSSILSIIPEDHLITVSYTHLTLPTKA